VAGSTLRQQLDEANAAVGILRSENKALRAEVIALRDRVTHLLAEMGKDSTNSSTPPSRDGVDVRKKRAKRRAEARQAKRAAGKQPGTPGANLRRRLADVTLGHEPGCCKGCGADLGLSRDTCKSR